MSNINFFSHAVLPSQTSRILDKTQKILGPKINPPPPTPNQIQAVIPEPWNFPWRIKWYGTPKNGK